MSESKPHVLAVIGVLSQKSSSRTVVHHVAAQLQAAGCTVDILDFAHEPLPLFNVETAYEAPGYEPLQKRVESADVILLATPDYHGSMSSALKNFLDHFWREFAGKLFASIVSSHEKGLTVTDQIRTVARQCYAWALPYGVSFVDRDDLKDNQVHSESLQKRLAMFSRDLRVYGGLLARQRHADLAAADPCFLAHHRK